MPLCIRTARRGFSGLSMHKQQVKDRSSEEPTLLLWLTPEVAHALHSSLHRADLCALSQPFFKSGIHLAVCLWSKPAASAYACTQRHFCRIPTVLLDRRTLCLISLHHFPTRPAWACPSNYERACHSCSGSSSVRLKKRA